MIDGNEIIYFVCEEPYSGVVKIGKTINIEKRLSGMQTGNYRKLKALMMYERPKKYDYEKVFHKLFYKNYVSGEWYNINRSMLMRIELIMKNNDVIDELHVLCSELLTYDTFYNADENCLTINNPPDSENRCGSKLHLIPKITKTKIEKIKGMKPISFDLKAVDAKAVADAPELTEEEFTAKITASKISKQDRSAINKYILRARYRYSDPIDLEWVKKYSDKKVLLMNKHIATRDIDIAKLGLFSEITLDNATDVQKLDKCKTSFMYNVARIKARDIFDKYNKTAEFPAKLTEFINKQIDINNPVFGNKKLNGVRLKCSLAAINDVLNVLGYDIRIKNVFKYIDKNKRIYEYEWYDIAPDYYCIPDKTEKDNKNPILPISYMLD